MPTLRYDEGIEILVSSANWTTDVVKIYAVRDTYTPAVGHVFGTSGLGAAAIRSSKTLAGKTLTGGKLSATDPVFDDMISGDPTIAHVVFTITTGGIEYLLCADDVADLAPDGNVITYQIDPTNGVLKL